MSEFKKFDKRENSGDDPYFRICQCGHYQHNHELNRWAGLRFGNCEKCLCPQLKVIGFVGFNEAKEIRKKLGVQD